MKLHEIAIQPPPKQHIRLIESIFGEGINYSLYQDGTVEIFEDAVIETTALPNGELPFKVTKVHGNLTCTTNGTDVSVGNFSKLRSLKNFPDIVMGNVKIRHSLITSFEGCPGSVHGILDLSWNQHITNLKGLPEFVQSDLVLDHCDSLNSLEGIPEEIGWIKDDCYLMLKECKSLKSLKGIDGLKKFKGGCLSMSFEIPNEHLLGVLLIDGLKHLYDHRRTNVSDVSRVWGIIESYLGRPEDVFECQEEILQFGSYYEKAAQV